MGTWNTRGLRGSTLEDLINHTNESYRDKHLALIQKIPTPITPIEIDKASRHITLAYFDQKSTVDYIGTVQGIPVCFDAKECAVKTFPLQNIHPHQIQFMKEFEEQGGIAFIILYFTSLNEMYYMPFEHIYTFGNGWRTADAKALHTTKWIRRGGYAPSGICWCIIWRRYRKTWTEGRDGRQDLPARFF